MFYQFVQLAQPVARNRGIHMVLRVVIHVPVEEPCKRIQNESSTAKSEIRHFILQANVLCVVAEEKQPPAVKGGERCQDGQQPELEIQGNDDNQSMPDKQGARPVDGKAPLRAAFGEKGLLPFAAQLAASDPDRFFHNEVGSVIVHKTLLKKVLNHDFDWQYDLEIIRGVQRVAVMPLVTRSKHLKIDPAKEGEDPDKQGVQPFCLEDRSMAKLMNPVDHECITHSVKENNQNHNRYGESPGRVKRHAPCQEKQPQVGKRLEQPLPIAALMKALQDFGSNRRSIPINRMRFAIMGHRSPSLLPRG